MTDNSPSAGDLFDQICELADAAVSGCATEEQWQRLDSLVEANDEALALYVDFMHESLAIRRLVRADRLAVSYSQRANKCDWFDTPLPAAARCAPQTVAMTGAKATGRENRRQNRNRSIAAAVYFVLAGLSLVAVCIGMLTIGAGPPAGAVPAAVGRMTHSVNVRWASGASRWSVDDVLAIGSTIEFDSGRIELQFDSGATMAVVGPANLEIQSAQLVALNSGAATTRIENGNSGEFRIVTPATEVLDLGTEFGVRARPDGLTEVVVFEGEVDVTPVVTAQSPSRKAQRLSIGEGVCVNARGTLDRIVSVDSDLFPLARDDRLLHRTRQPLIVGVADDLRSPEGGKFYRIYREGLGEDVRAFVDRTHEWNGLTDDGIPAFLRGADYVATFNDDKKPARHADPNTIAVQLSGPALLYVLYDDRLAVPQWLSSAFEDTGFDVGLDKGRFGSRPFDVAVGPGKSIDVVCSIWLKRVESGQSVELGQVGAPRAGTDGQRVMYGIAAQPLAVP